MKLIEAMQFNKVQVALYLKKDIDGQMKPWFVIQDPSRVLQGQCGWTGNMHVLDIITEQLLYGEIIT